MKRFSRYALLFGTLAASLTSCGSLSQQNGQIVGGTLGAGIGAGIGGSLSPDQPVEGAIVGGLAGMVAGAEIGRNNADPDIVKVERGD